MLDRMLRKETISIEGDYRKYKGQAVFACTHIGKGDAEKIFEKFGRACWWFVGDPCFLYRDISGLCLYLNG